ncbi:MAG: nucleoside monophosphate kinase [Patescibacteria group bacterium]|nr:nucleoside monophosphate kinase [Patescibacteria group bacterium]
MKKKVKKIIVLGPQGSGKDTQSEKLSKELKIPFFGMGDIFRQELKNKTKIGKKVADLINKGQLVPDKIALELLKKRLAKKKAQKGFILNGFPRNINQAKMLEKVVIIDLVMEIYISDKEGIHRLSGRRVCPVCGATFHIKYKPPKEENICDYCGAELIVREDDKEQAIKKRLKIYHQRTEPVFDYYRQKGLYLKINGEQTINNVFKEIINKLKKIIE